MNIKAQNLRDEKSQSDNWLEERKNSVALDLFFFLVQSQKYL